MANIDAPAPGVSRRLVVPDRLRAYVETYGALIGLIVLFLYNVFFTPNFLTAQTMYVNLTQVATIAIVATGMTLVIATGGIDLSVGSLMAISGAIAPLVFLSQVGQGASLAVIIPLSYIIAILITGVFGSFNGFLVAYGKIQPIIATLILYIAGRGIAQVLTNGNLQTFNNPVFQYIGMGRPGGVPFQVILMLVIVAIAAWVMRYTTFGRYVLAVGGNESAARLAGVPIKRIKMAVYIISGLLAGIAGLIVIAINSSSDANLVGLNMELDAIAAVAVGGTPLTGGRATIIGTFIGALIMQLIRFTLLAHGIPDAAAMAVKAAIIVVAAMVQLRRTA
ncbi:MAG: ABC transporter permease [Anaerolineae bacterium]